jgi:hypothetical protein
MNARSVLVAYATRYGSTQEVAQTIAATLREAGLEVDVQPMREVKILNGAEPHPLAPSPLRGKGKTSVWAVLAAEGGQNSPLKLSPPPPAGAGSGVRAARPNGEDSAIEVYGMPELGGRLKKVLG